MKQYGICNKCHRVEYLENGVCRICSFSTADLRRIAARIVFVDEMGKEPAMQPLSNHER